MYVVICLTSFVVATSPLATAQIRPYWYDCEIDDVSWDPDAYDPCPSGFTIYSFVEGYEAHYLGDDVDNIYWRLRSSLSATEWFEVDNFASAGSYQYQFNFTVDIGPSTWEWLDLWADGTTDHYGACEIQ